MYVHPHTVSAGSATASPSSSSARRAFARCSRRRSASEAAPTSHTVAERSLLDSSLLTLSSFCSGFSSHHGGGDVRRLCRARPVTEYERGRYEERTTPCGYPLEWAASCTHRALRSIDSCLAMLDLRCLAPLIAHEGASANMLRLYRNFYRTSHIS